MHYLLTILIFLVISVTLNVFVVIRIGQREQEATRREERQRKGWRKYLPLIILNLTIAISITFTIKIEISNNKQNNENVNRAPRPSPSTQDTDQEAKQLRDKLRTPFEGDGFTLKPLLESELVKGREGAYYDLIIKGPALFPIGEYIIKDQEKEYSEPLKNFFKDVIVVLRRAHIDHELFVKGSADKTGDTTFSKNFVIDRYSFREIPYLKYDPHQQQFTQNQQPWRIPGPYTNKDLPQLRARYTQYSLKNSASELDSTILEGVVTPRIDEPEDRNIVILLYIRWT